MKEYKEENNALVISDVDVKMKVSIHFQVTCFQLVNFVLEKCTINQRERNFFIKNVMRSTRSAGSGGYS